RGVLIAVYLANLGLLSTAGLIIGALVRPKNRAADIAAGTATGLLFGGTVVILIGGWFASILTAVWPIEEDLNLLSRAAWGEPVTKEARPDAEGKVRPSPGERLLEKYPDLRAVSANERGRVFAAKVRADLIAGLPFGTWISVLLVLVVGVPMVTVQVMVAGPL